MSYPAGSSWPASSRSFSGRASSRSDESPPTTGWIWSSAIMLPFFEWMESLQVSAALDTTGYLGAGINVLHLFALTLFLGATLVVDLRLLGRGMNRQPLPDVARNAQPWMIAGFAGLALTGIMQVLTVPMKAYY